MSDEIVVPLILRVPRASVDAWNEIADDGSPGFRPMAAEEYIDGIVNDDLNADILYSVERAPEADEDAIN